MTKIFLLSFSLLLLVALPSGYAQQQSSAAATTQKSTTAAATTKKTTKKTVKKRVQKPPKYSIPKNDSLSLLARYAQFLQEPDTCVLNRDLYASIDEWIGTPYRYGQSSKKGTDCSGFIGKIFDYLYHISLPRSAAGVAKVIVEKPQAELQEGDIVVFNFRRRNSHVGIYLRNGWFIHASNVYGVTLANLDNAYYQKRYSKGGSLPAMSNTPTEN